MYTLINTNIYKIFTPLFSKMTEVEKLFDNLIEKSGKTKEELNSMIEEKVNELSGLISEEGAIYIIANELNVRLENDKPKREANLKKVEEITTPKEPVSLVAKVIRKYDKVNFTSKNGEGSVQSLLVGDETGITRCVFWYDKTEVLDGIQENDIIKIINAYTRENNQNTSRIEVHFGQYSELEVNPEGVEITLKEFEPQNFDSTEKKISEIEDGDRNIRVTALITDFDIPRFYLGCPQCFKKVMQDDDVSKCAVHEEVEAIKIPIINLKIDDGTGTIDIVGFRDRAEHVTKLSANEIIQLTEDVEKYRDFSKKIIGSKIQFVGNQSTNNMTGEGQLLVNQVVSIELQEGQDSPKEELEKTKKTSNTDDEDAKYEADAELNNVDDLDIEEIDIDDDML